MRGIGRNEWTADGRVRSGGAAPTAPWADRPHDALAELSPLWPRAAGFLADAAIHAGLVVPVILLIGQPGAPLRPLVELAAVVTYLGVGLWFACMMGVDGQTPGMRIVGVKAVAADDGGPIGLGAALLRWASLVGITCLGLLVLSGPPLAGVLAVVWAWFDVDRRTLYDRMARTVVVSVPRAAVSWDVLRVEQG